MKTRPAIRKGDRLIVNIESLGPGGEGVAKPEGLPVFITRVAPGDKVEIEIYDVRKTFAFGKVLRLIEASGLRTEPPCKLFKVCGGCHWQHINYASQVDLKTDIVKQAIRHVGGLDEEIVLPALAAEEPLFYRNKVQFPVDSPHNSSRILAGYYKEGSHELVNIKHCPIQPEPLDRLLEHAKASLEQHGIIAYKEKEHRGVLRHINARYSFAYKEALVTFVINEPAPGAKTTRNKLAKVAHDLMTQMPEIVGVCLNFNPDRGNKIMGTGWEALAGRSILRERLFSTSDQADPLHKNGIEFQLTPMSFFQINSHQSVKLLDLVFKALKDNSPQPPELVVDAYGGVGTIALWLSPYAKKLISIEEVSAAVEDGKSIAKINNVDNLSFEEGKVEKLLPEIAANSAIDAVVVDPPRKGLSPEIIDTIARSGTKLVIYVSCNPVTLARDLKLFANHGYHVRSIQPLDMFPQTYHVESVCVVAKDI